MKTSSFLSSPTALWIMTISIGLYAGDGFGWQVGAALSVAFLVFVYVANALIVIKFGNLLWTTRARILLFLLFMAVIGVLRAETCDGATQKCAGPIGGRVSN